MNKHQHQTKNQSNMKHNHQNRNNMNNNTGLTSEQTDIVLKILFGVVTAVIILIGGKKG